MALLLNVRRLSQTASKITPSVDAAYWPDMDVPSEIFRNESTVSLVEQDAKQKGEDKTYPEGYEHGAFQNPSFQVDGSGDNNYPSSDGHATDVEDKKETRIPSVDTVSSDSGIIEGNITPKDSKKNDDTFSNTIANKCNGSSDSGIHVSPKDCRKNNYNNHKKRRSSMRIIADALKLPKEDIEKQDYTDSETLLATCVQVFIPFLIAGIGTCGAGLVLDNVEDWEVFKKVSELFILVPTLLGLKGNLEMTLASRVSTQVNLGKAQTWQDRWSICWGNMALVQCQASVMAFLSSCFATIMSTIKTDRFDIERALLLGGSALFTASLASLLLGTLTLVVVLAAHKFKINPDNIATPLAASIGDVTTLGILAAIASYFKNLNDKILPPSLCVGVFMALVPLWAYISFKNSFVKKVLFSGWIPVIVACAITSAGGYILELSIAEFKGLAVFQPVINGVAGNLVAVQASRISTYFHGHSIPGNKPPDGSSVCISPVATFFSKRGPHARTARILIAMVIPGHLLFGYGITLVKGGDTALTPTFLPIYLTAAVLQVAGLLYIAQCLIQILWLFRVDPDNSAIPLLTALGDLSGMIALSLAFLLHSTVVVDPIEYIPSTNSTNYDNLTTIELFTSTMSSTA